MLVWLIAVAVLVFVWGLVWKRNNLLSFGILVGLFLAWFFSLLIKPYILGIHETGMEDFPIWLPPLPLATVAIVLFFFGARTWIRGNDVLPQKKQDDTEHH